jgi:hypothetical protein
MSYLVEGIVHYIVANTICCNILLPLLCYSIMMDETVSVEL